MTMEAPKMFDVIDPEKNEVQKESESYPKIAREAADNVKDLETYNNAAAILVSIKGFEKKVGEHYDDDIAKAHALHRSLTTKKNMALMPLRAAEMIIKPALAAYISAEEKKQRAEEERVMAAQRKQNEEAQLAEAQEAVKNGDLGAANAILEAPPAPIIMPVIPQTKAAGISMSDTWHAEAFDLKTILTDVVAGKTPMSVIEINTKVVNSLVKNLKGEFKYRGFKVWSEKSVSAKSR
jgi:hypothetical protein